MKRLLEKFGKGISAVKNAEKLIVALSGGADSSLLLDLTCRYFENASITVEAAHLNHMIRAEEADRDEAFCRVKAEQYGIKLHVKRVDIPALTANGGGTEEVARRERYAFFEELWHENSEKGISTYILTAHNADDNLETVIFNLLRGSALKGMCGIPPVRDSKYVRPMLAFSATEIRSACEKHNVPYVTDTTNLTCDYTRNYIRHNVTPHLSHIVGDPESAVLRMCESLRCDEDFLSLEADRIIGEEDFILNESASRLHPAILSRVILKLYSKASENASGKPHLEKQHVDRIISYLKSNGGRYSTSVPGGISFVSDGIASHFSFADRRKSVTLSAETDSFECELAFDEPVTHKGYTVLLTDAISDHIKDKNENIYNLSIYKTINFDKIKGKLKYRTRKDGDMFRFAGMTRKVKKLFSERKLSSEERSSLPILFDDGGIVWIPGFPVRDGMKPTTQEKAAYLLCYRENDQISGENND